MSSFRLLVGFHLIALFCKEGMLWSYNKTNKSLVELGSRRCTNKLVKHLGDRDLLSKDFVQMQYKKLPYPMVSEYELKKEQSFYNNTIIPGNIFKTTADNDVEILNDFLFQGKRDVE